MVGPSQLTTAPIPDKLFFDESAPVFLQVFRICPQVFELCVYVILTVKATEDIKLLGASFAARVNEEQPLTEERDPLPVSC